MSDSDRWGDLNTRLISAGVMSIVGLLLLWLGSVPFELAIWALGGVMVWELARLSDKPFWAPGMGVVAGLALVLAWFLPLWLTLPGLIALAGYGGWLLGRRRILFGVYAAVILLGSHVAVLLRIDAGMGWLLWIVCLVIASDVAGYVAGRTIGGPKLWPAISPKKTWSGTIAGWLAALLVGLVFGLFLGVGAKLMLLSVFIAIAGQAGDIWESWIKRQVGVKDSSNLIPGHGGVLDRFDAMLGALLLTGWLWLFGLIPGII